MERSIHVPFTSDTYDTPPDTPRYLLDRLVGTRWNLYLRHIAVVLSARALATKGRFDDEAWVAHSLAVFRHVERCGGRFHLSGLDTLRTQVDPVVIISNHMSAAETQLFPCVIVPFMRATFVVKQSLVTHPIFGPVMRSRDPIVVSRKDPRKDMEAVLTQGSHLLRRGVSVIVFPQATRRLRFVPEEFNSLGIKLARTAGVRVIPAAVKTDFWGNGKILRDFGPVGRNKPIYMAFGEALEVSGNGKAQHQAVIEFIRDRLRSWGGLA